MTTSSDLRSSIFCALPRVPLAHGGVTIDNCPEQAEAEAEADADAEAGEDGGEEHLPDASERVLKLPLSPPAMLPPHCFGRLLFRPSVG